MDIPKKIADWSVPPERADFLTETLGSYAEAILLGEHPFILFGAGSAGQRLLPLFKRHGTPPIFICDNDPAKIGGQIDGTPIVSVAAAHASLPDAVVVLAAGRWQEKIREQLTEAGFSAERIRMLEPAPLTFYTHIDQWYWSPADLAETADELARAYSLLADDASRRLFLQRTALLSSGSDYRAYLAYVTEHSFIGKYPAGVAHRGPENFYYFNNDVVQLGDKETLVDCGAFDGDSLEQFLRVGRRLPQAAYTAHCLEPDPDNFIRLAESYREDGNVHLYQTGAWSEKATLNFESSNSPLVDCPSSARISDRGTGLCIEADALDQILSEQDISFIKMDIEGAEREALLGSANILTRCKPTLAISVYHLRDDIFRILLLIDELCPGYRFYLRLFSQNFTETVLLAVHSEKPASGKHP